MRIMTMVTKWADGQGGGEGVITIQGDEQELGLLYEVLQKGNEHWGDNDIRTLKQGVAALLIRIDDTIRS